MYFYWWLIYAWLISFSFSCPNVSDVVVLVAVVILVGLFSMQHYGTDKVGWLFAPIVLLWFLLIGAVGALNIWKYDSSVLRAYNPVYIYRYFRRGKVSWTSLGGILLSITGEILLNWCMFLWCVIYVFLGILKANLHCPATLFCRDRSVIC